MSAPPPGIRSRVLRLTSAQWAAAGVATGLLGLLLWFAYQRGTASAGLQSVSNAFQRRELMSRIAALEDENGMLNAKVAELEMSRRLDKEAYGQVERTLGELQSAMSRQDREFLLRLTLIQAMRHDNVAAGLVQIALSGLQQEHPTRYTVGELLGRPSAKMPFSFKYFQTIEQIIELPAGFEPYTVDVTVTSSRIRGPVERSFPWKTGSQAAL